MALVADNPLHLEADAAPASPLVAARLKAANILHGAGLLLMLMIFCALVVLINSVDKLTAASSVVSIDAATTNAADSSISLSGTAPQSEPEPEPGAEVDACPFGGSESADDAVEGLLRQDGFFTLFTDNTTAPGKVLLAIPDAEIDQPFILNSLRWVRKFKLIRDHSPSISIGVHFTGLHGVLSRGQV